MVKCAYRANTECRMPKRANTDSNCQLCLIGQLCDETSLNTRAVMSLSMDRMEEKAIKEGYQD